MPCFRANECVLVPFRFNPIQTTLPDSSYSGSGGPVVKRDALLGIDITIGSGGSSPKQYATSPKQYPKGVTCYKLKHGRCVKSVSITTITQTVGPSTVVTTTTDTSTVYPSATA